MATKTWVSATASTWATAASWSPSGVPAAGDAVIFNGSANGNCTVGANTNSLLSLDTTGYTGNIIFNAVISVAGNVTLSSGTTYSGASILSINASSTFAPNGATLGCQLRFQPTAAATIQLTGNLTLSSAFLSYGVPAYSVNFQSSVPGTQRIVTLQNVSGATQYVDYTNVTDINGSNGCTLWTYKGTVSNSSNWYVMTTQPPTYSKIG